jgi:hypothetical protein
VNQPNDDGWQHPAASEYSAATVALLTSATPCKCSKFGTQPAAATTRICCHKVPPPGLRATHDRTVHTGSGPHRPSVAEGAAVKTRRRRR